MIETIGLFLWHVLCAAKLIFFPSYHLSSLHFAQVVSFGLFQSTPDRADTIRSFHPNRDPLWPIFYKYRALCDRPFVSIVHLTHWSLSFQRKILHQKLVIVVAWIRWLLLNSMKRTNVRDVKRLIEKEKKIWVFLHCIWSNLITKKTNANDAYSSVQSTDTFLF